MRLENMALYGMLSSGLSMCGKLHLSYAPGVGEGEPGTHCSSMHSSTSPKKEWPLNPTQGDQLSTGIWLPRFNARTQRTLA